MGHLAYKFRLYPNATQEKALVSQLETLRRVYNDALQLHRDVYTVTGKSPCRGFLNRTLVLSRNAQLDDLKNGRGGPKWLTQVSAVSLRDVCARVEVAFDNFFRRLKEGAKKAGFPRFKKYGKLTSIPFENTYPAGCVVRDRDGYTLGVESGSKRNRKFRPLAESRRGCRLDVFGVGPIRIIAHRAVVGTIKTACVERDVDGKWYVVFTAEQETPTVDPKEGPAVGIDMGLEHFLTTSDGRHEPNPQALQNNLKSLRRLQRSSSRKQEAAKKRKSKFRECKNLQKVFSKTARLHVRIRNLRKEHHYQVAIRLLHECGAVCAEKLNVRGMVRNGKLSRAIQDAGWSAFLNVLSRKAKNAGARFVEVDARGTSQTCPQCGAVAKKKLAERRHCCPCGYTTHRDHAAAQVILQRGTIGDGAGSALAVRVDDSALVEMPREQSSGGRGEQQNSFAKSVASKVPKANRSRSRDKTPPIPGME